MNLWQNYKKVLFNTFDLDPDATSMQGEPQASNGEPPDG